VARRHGVAPNQLFTWRRLVLSRPGPPATNLPVVAQPHQLRAEQYRKFRGETWLQDQLFASQTCGRVTAGRGRRLGSVLSSHSFGEQTDRTGNNRHCAFGSATVEAPTGCAVASNRLASITMFASMLNTDTRNGASRRVPTILHFATFRKIFDKWGRRAMAGDWFVAYGTHHYRPCVSLFGRHLVNALECELEIVAVVAIEDR
jgi:hypothetical protein